MVGLETHRLEVQLLDDGIQEFGCWAVNWQAFSSLGPSTHGCRWNRLDVVELDEESD